MQKEYRQAARERLGTKAWIRLDEGFPVRPCVVANLSNTEVRLLIDEPHAVAGHFNLLLQRDAVPGRRCRVVWRRGSEIGAEFA